MSSPPHVWLSLDEVHRRYAIDGTKFLNLLARGDLETSDTVGPELCFSEQSIQQHFAVRTQGAEFVASVLANVASSVVTGAATYAATKIAPKEIGDRDIDAIIELAPLTSRALEGCFVQCNFDDGTREFFSAYMRDIRHYRPVSSKAISRELARWKSAPTIRADVFIDVIETFLAKAISSAGETNVRNSLFRLKTFLPPVPTREIDDLDYNAEIHLRRLWGALQSAPVMIFLMSQEVSVPPVHSPLNEHLMLEAQRCADVCRSLRAHAERMKLR